MYFNKLFRLYCVFLRTIRINLFSFSRPAWSYCYPGSTFARRSTGQYLMEMFPEELPLSAARKKDRLPNVIKLMWRRDTLSSEMMRGYFFFLNILDTMVGLCGRFYWSYIKPNKSGPLIRGKTHTWKEVFKWMQHVWNDLWSNKYFGLNIMYTSNRIDLILHNHRNQKENALQLCESLSTDRIIYKVKFIFIICSEGGFSFIPHYLWGWLSWLRRSRRWVQNVEISRKSSKIKDLRNYPKVLKNGADSGSLSLGQ